MQGALHQALQELAVQPFRNPRLQTHAVQRAQPDTFTSYVGNQGHRLIWRRIGNVIILLLFGEHDPVYRRAERLRLDTDDELTALEQTMHPAAWEEAMNLAMYAHPDGQEAALAAAGGTEPEPTAEPAPADGRVYDAVVIDEAQDLTENAVRLLAPVTVSGADLEEHDLALAAAIQEAATAGTGPGDVAVAADGEVVT